MCSLEEYGVLGEWTLHEVFFTMGKIDWFLQ